MNINNIKEQLAMRLPVREEWFRILEHSSPGHYGIIESDVSVSRNNICVDIPKHTFRIKDVQFDFILQLGNSSGEVGFAQRFSRYAKGEGRFYFDEGTEKIFIEKLKLKVDLDLFG